jgi:hypothetical protein
MARIAPDAKASTQELQAAFERYKTHLGFVPNRWGNRPAQLVDS